MKYYIFIQNNEIIGAGQAEILNTDINTVEVSEEIYNKFIEDKDSVVWDIDKEEVVENPDYEEIKARQREEEFHSQFFKTSLGYIRRQARMKDGKIKDFGKVEDVITSQMLKEIFGVNAYVGVNPINNKLQVSFMHTHEHINGVGDNHIHEDGFTGLHSHEENQIYV